MLGTRTELGGNPLAEPPGTPPQAPARELRVVIACPGVAHIARGFETFAQECFAALRGQPGLRMALVGASGPKGGGRHRAPTLRKEGRVASALGAVVRRDAYWVEQLSFAASLVPLLRRAAPDVVYLSDWVLGLALGRLRTATGMRFRVLLSNGAPGYPPFDAAFDHVQQITPALYDAALAGGEPPARHTLLPLGVAVGDQPRRAAREERAALRRELGLPAEGEILLSVAALNCWSKRLDFLAREVAGLSSRPHLVLLGERDAEAAQVVSAARAALGSDGFSVRTVAPAAVARYYRAADMAVLASIHESMGRVLVESLAHGLRTIAHDSEVMRYVTGGHALLRDLRSEGSLAAAIEEARALPDDDAARLERYEFARDRFGWHTLRPQYLEMIRRCAAA